MFKIKKNLFSNFSDEWLLSNIHQLYTLFESGSFELYLVGGSVRDLLLGREPKDFDFCTNATPEQMKELVENWNKKNTKYLQFGVWDSGIKHGTLTITHDFSFEVTTYRVDSDYEDHRHPNSVEFTKSLEEDLKRRDFTINSFAYNARTKEVSMLDESFLDDLEYGIIKTVGNPKERFTEDALRMLRALRFSAQLGFTIEYNTFKAIQELNYTLDNISVERCRDELTKIVLSDHVEVLDLLRTTGLDCYLGGVRLHLNDYINCPQINKYHYTDVWHHTLDVIKYCPKDFEVRFAALFHDIGKLKCQEIDQDGYCHYRGHPDISAIDAEKLMFDLKFTNNQQEDILKLIKYHDENLADMSVSDFKKTLVKIGVSLFPKFLKLRYADAMAHRLYEDNDLYVKRISIIKERFIAVLKANDPLYIKDLAVDGNNLLALGYKGKEIGDTLAYLLEAVLEVPELNKKDTLLNLLKSERN